MNRTNRIAINAILIASSIVFTRFLSIRFTLFGVEHVRIGIGVLPLLLAGFMFEPIDAILVGAISDLIGYFLYPLGPYIPYFTITAALRGWIPAMIHKYIYKKSFAFWPILISNGVGQTINAIILVPYLLHTIFHIPYILLLIPRLVSFPIYLFLYPFLILIIIEKTHQYSKISIEN